MLSKLKKLFTPQVCVVCKGKPINPRDYLNDQGEKIKVCEKCITYAERRAFQRA